MKEGRVLVAKEQLLSLLRVQELANEIRAAQGILDEAPRKVEEIEQRFRDRNAEYVAIKDRYEELDQDQRSRSGELSTLEDSKKKFMDDLMQVKNQREYAAMLSEIDTVKAQISDHEEAILRDLEEIEKLKGELETHEQHIVAEREAVAKERAEVEAGAEEAQAQIDRREKERREVEAGLPRDVISAIRRLEPRRQGIFLAKAETGTCQSCYVRVRPQVFQEIKAAVAVHSCESCKRFLYHPSLKEAAARAAASEGLETANGGAV
jgi:predicted  nucleic acid-binding Zn-ribbon protein